MQLRSQSVGLDRQHDVGRDREPEVRQLAGLPGIDQVLIVAQGRDEVNGLRRDPGTEDGLRGLGAEVDDSA